ncbi:amidohydrolase family protein [Teichococcus aestuarii]|uniref:2-pyrone-4,6-dicarboxylate hydrolase n=1 Tax=Teichococcus aestuarii TaxID=568898 RepID=A0A2U1UXK8_9PROT|nr:amidohydrolase family protein [Pseudoroseomonas aestuarii]PWC26415.1 2-pyrone-4,6-dicarboxylate hydrolase [Pseudoroseomonas aestuarii]
MPTVSSPVPWSAGTAPPSLAVPAGATDCHFHVYDARWPSAAGTPHHPDATAEHYRLLQTRLGLSRGILVQPSAYGTDNSLHLQALEVLGRDRFRLVAVVPPDISDSALRAMDDAGVRGIRFNLTMPGVLRAEDLTQLARRVAPLGWHLQVNAAEATLLAAEPMLGSLPCPLVLDHIGQVPQPGGTATPAFQAVRRLLDAGRTWVKLSGAYIRSRSGAPRYADAGVVAAALVRSAPERMLWGSDWPHPTQPLNAKPDDAILLDLLAEWVPDPATRSRVLVENPSVVYGFSRSG